MEKYRIKILNKLAEEGLEKFSSNFDYGTEIDNPHGIVVRSSNVDIADFPGVLAVARAGAGVNNISVDKATDAGVCVFNTPGANANAVAELVFVMLGMCARNIHLGARFCSSLGDLDDDEIANRVETQKSKYKGFELVGKTLGVIGLGKIGVLVANSGAARQMNVIGFDPYPAMENIHALSPDVVFARTLKEITEKADIISLHIPLTENTRGFLGDEAIGQMQKGVILINFARGPIVDEDAVLSGIEVGKIANYITDFPSKKVIDNPQIICTPHLGASTEESEEHCASMAVQEIKGYLEYGTISHSVNFPTTESIPAGNVHTRLIMINRDIPGMIGFASQIIGSHGINIISYNNESNGTIGYNIIDLESEISQQVIEEIENNSDVIRTRTIRF